MKDGDSNSREGWVDDLRYDSSLPSPLETPMIEDLKLRGKYGGFLFLADAARGIPWLKTHQHAELEINLVARGSVTYVIGESSYTFHQGECVWLFPGQPHRCIDRTADALYYVISFKPSLIARSCHRDANAILKKNRPPKNAVLHCILPPAKFGLLRGIMDSLLEEGLDADTLNREVGYGISPGFRYEHPNPDLLNAGLAHILQLAWDCQLASETKRRAAPLHPSVLKALDILKKGSESECLQKLAHECGASASYLSRTFKQQVGVPINRYRNTMRLERFWEIRKNSSRHMTLSEAVYEAGFGSYAQFSKVHRSIFGRSPREIDNKIRKSTQSATHSQ
ncbi:MAG: helix-turn-helix domain-containing protein [Terrimicrobiaceae bacterium]